MGRPGARPTGKKPALRSSNLPSSPVNPPSSGGTAIPDDISHAVGNGGASGNPSGTQSALTDGSRVSQSLEPLPIRSTPNPYGTPCTTVGEEASLLGAGVNIIKGAIATVSKLQGLGLGEYNIPLPKCVVLGEQSTGKSSVIERISGIKSPRSDGTCTRCPLYIQLEDVDDPRARWQARVALRSSFDYDGQTDNQRQYPGWLPAPPREIPFASTERPEQLEELILRAQLATLCARDVDYKSFLYGPLDQLDRNYRQAQFSPNCVCIYVSQPGLPPLSFYDLPGVIGQSEDLANHYLVKFVKDLVTEHIGDPNSLILVTCALSNDIHNSQAAGIARDLNATERCVGVLTKPDCFPSGSRADNLQAILDNRKFQLGHGYFVDARAQEQRFFENEEPWATTLRSFQPRFGAANLQTYLSKVLAAQASRALPVIRARIGVELEKVETELSKIPESPTHNAIHIVHELLGKFAREIELQMDGETGHNDWRNSWELIQGRFAQGLLAMKPKLQTMGQRDKGLSRTSSKGTSADECIVIDSDDDDEDDEMSSPEPETPSKKRKLDGKSNSGTPVKPKSAPSKGPSKAPPPETDEFHKHVIRFNLDEIAAHMKQTSKSKIPDELQPKVLDKMILETMKHWGLPMARFFAELENSLRKHLREVFEYHFRAWTDAEMYTATWKTIDELLKCNFDLQCITTAPEALDDELKGPYIYHKQVWDSEIAHVQELYAQARYRTRMKQYFDELDAATGKTTTKNERELRAQKDKQIHSILSKEPYAVELGVVAKITSYYTIASRRFHDSVCMRIESKFFDMLKTSLMSELTTGLETGGERGHSNCVRLLAENTVRGARRRELLRAKESLLKGQQLLDDLKAQYATPAPPTMNGNGPQYTPPTAPMMNGNAPQYLPSPVPTTNGKGHQAYVSSPNSSDAEMVDELDMT